MTDLQAYADRTRRLPAPPHVVWGSLTRPRDPRARPWLELLPDEVEPRVVESRCPELVVWSSLWPSRPRDLVRFELAGDESRETRLRFLLLTPDDLPDPSRTGHLRLRINTLLWADLRYSYGQ